MQLRIISLLTCFAGFGIVAACSVVAQNGGGSETPPAPKRKSATYTLTAGQSVALTPTATLKLERVNDSRCKTGAVCVWEGYISYSFVLTNNGNASNFVLAEKMPGGSNTATQQGLRFTLTGLEPPDPPAVHAPAPTYRVSLRVDIS
ncbi:hypothetical protein ASD15_03425 [Massilia sp. Root351]|jgi:hypothetical protein|uniref:hypothetical protein n=1 Tax=Massilia sp. Root351 TaxID=1736522 RepID=UPI00070C4DDB|nr:hypothetical protein [Massilia sp. Root351]KQV91114.1 hypothetical protein ASD15_03425 [Massilia sp. Root351]